MKIATVVGARPQFIKAAMVSRCLSAQHLQEIVIHTGQHFDANMSEVFFDELELPRPNYNLGIGGGSHGQNTGRMIEAIEEVLCSVEPDWMLVYGDTDSTLAGALAAAKLHIPVAHVEAGLRSFNRKMPEEINRVLVDHAADLLFAPTRTALNNLGAEGINGDQIRLTGDVMYDAALFYGARAEERSDVFVRLGLSRKAYVLATVHRAENTDDPRRLGAIMRALVAFAADVPVLLPLHPRTRSRLADLEVWRYVRRALTVIEPVGYLDMVMLEKNARLIVTDSGGVQKEAYYHKVPCVTLRDETEWVELVETGWNQIAPPLAGNLEDALRVARAPTQGSALLYGTGDAGARIAQALVKDAQ